MGLPPQPSLGQSPDSTGASTREWSARLLLELQTAAARGSAGFPTVEQLLEDAVDLPSTLDSDALTDVVYAEWMLRGMLGLPRSQDDYRTRFPSLAERLDRQWLLDASLVTLLETEAGTQSQPAAFDVRAPIETASPAEGPATLGKYRILARLGGGGQANVFRAWHPDLQREVVLKQLRRDGDFIGGDAHAPPALEQVFREARLLARLDHPHIGRIYDVDQDSGLPFLVLEAVPGVSLDQYCKTCGHDWRHLSGLLIEIAEAVAAAHAQGILHRDLKPQNVIITPNGTAKLIDFGLAHLADAWHVQQVMPGVTGTLAYLAPEQAAGDPARLGVAVDVFGLGTILYHMLTGHPPYHGAPDRTGLSLSGLVERARQGGWDRAALANPEIPRSLAAICELAMATEPEQRYGDAREFAAAVRAAFKDSAQATRRRFLLGISGVWISAAIWAIWRLRFPPRPVAAPPTPPAATVRANLQISIHVEDGRRIALPEAVPLKTGAHISLTARIPAGFAVRLYSINGQGICREVARWDRRAEEEIRRFPDPADQAVPLTGPIGTECLAIVGAPGEFAAPPERLWRQPADWPALAPATVLRLTGMEIEVEQTGRDLGEPLVAGSSPQAAVEQSLQLWGQRLARTSPLVEALAFRHDAGNLAQGGR